MGKRQWSVSHPGSFCAYTDAQRVMSQDVGTLMAAISAYVTRAQGVSMMMIWLDSRCVCDRMGLNCGSMIRSVSDWRSAADWEAGFQGRRSIPQSR